MSKQHQNTKVFMNSPKYDLGSVQLSSTCLDIQGFQHRPRSSCSAAVIPWGGLSGENEINDFLNA